MRWQEMHKLQKLDRCDDSVGSFGFICTICLRPSDKVMLYMTNNNFIIKKHCFYFPLLVRQQAILFKVTKVQTYLIKNFTKFCEFMSVFGEK